MYLTVSKKNKSNGQKKEWTFIVKQDYSCLNLEDADNQLVFSRFCHYDKKGKPLATYDTDKSCPNTNCKWKYAEPSDEILEKALKKLIDSWSLSVNKSR